MEDKLKEYYKLRNNSHQSDSDQKRINEIASEMYPLFMQVRMKMNLDSRTTILQWLDHESNELMEIENLLSNDLIISENKPVLNSTEIIWMKAVCDSLNEAGLKFKGNGKWDISNFKNIYELIRYHVTYDRGIYNYLNDKGVINTGSCPITGEKSSPNYAYSFFGRGIYMSKNGLEQAKREDPDYDEKLAKLKHESRQQSSSGCLELFVIATIIFVLKFFI